MPFNAVGKWVDKIGESKKTNPEKQILKVIAGFIPLVAHRFGQVEFRISNIWFDFFKCTCLKKTTTNTPNSKFDTSKSMNEGPWEIRLLLLCAVFCRPFWTKSLQNFRFSLNINWSFLRRKDAEKIKIIWWSEKIEKIYLKKFPVPARSLNSRSNY